MELTGGPKIQSRPKMRLEKVTYRIGEKDILQGVSGAVHTNRLTGLIGPNGAGKSTLLRLLGGLRHPSAGRIVLEERDLATFSALERARCLAMVPQNPAVGFGFTVEQVVAMGRHPFLRRLQPLTPHCRSVIDEAMASTRVEHLRSRMLTELSGGEQQRVFLARALAQEPKILLLDEPTANLDVRFQLELFALIDRLQRERPLTVVVALHDLTMALRYCDQVIVLHEGCMRAEGAPERVITPALVEAVFGVRAGKVDGAFGPLVDLNPL